MLISNITTINTKWILKGQFDSKEENDVFFSGDGDLPRFIKLNNYIERNGNSIKIILPMSLFQKISIDSNLSFSLCVSANHRKTIKVISAIENYASKIWGGIYIFRLIADQHGIKLFAEKRKQYFTISDLKIVNHTLSFRIENFQKMRAEKVELYFKRRMTEQLWQHSDKEIFIGHVRPDGYVYAEIPFHELYEAIETQHFDMILKQMQGNTRAEYFVYPAKEYQSGSVIFYDTNDTGNLRGKLEIYCSAGKNLSLRFFKKYAYEATVKNLAVHDRTIRLSVSIPASQSICPTPKVAVCKRTYSNEKKYCIQWTKELFFDGEDYIFEELTENFLKSFVKKCDEFWDVYIKDRQDLIPVRCDTNIKADYFDAAGGFKVCFFCNSDKNLSVYTHEGIYSDNHKTNIAVLGTCFSRSVFKSDPYFNPDYKKFYNCVYTQYHSSVISMTSAQLQDYECRDQWDKEAALYMPTEFRKDFFEKLANSKAEYLLIDNYVDATRPIIAVGNKTYITYNKYLINSNMIRDLADCQIIKPGTEEFYTLYRKHAKIFIHEVKKYIPENHIILLQARFSYYKIDEKTNVKQEWAGKSYIQRNNIRWDNIDHIFISLAPDIRIIDMRNTQYVSDVHSPIPGGASPSHYQKFYYREILDKINKIVLEDKISKGESC